MTRRIIFLPLMMAIVVAAAGLITYTQLRESFTLPEDLKAVATRAGTLSQIRSHAPQSGDSRLTAEQVNVFLGALDPIAKGWNRIQQTLDSLDGLNRSRSKVDFWGSPYFIRQVNLAPLTARKALVDYLNGRSVSWQQYIWIKEHVVAGSGITRREFDSAFDQRLRVRFNTADSASTNKLQAGADSLFASVAAIRASSGADSLARSAAGTVLSKGFPALLSLETRFSDE